MLRLSTLDKASVAFNGNPSPLTIKKMMDAALTLYNTPITDENYSRAASTLRLGHIGIQGLGSRSFVDHS